MDGRNPLPLPVLLTNYKIKNMLRDECSWFRSRSYLHFDVPVGLKQALKVVSNPQAVALHSFHPFIHFAITQKKIKFNKDIGAIESTEKLRPIAYASHMDAHIYSYYSERLSELYEAEVRKRNIQENVIAFRALGKSNVDFAHQAFVDIENQAPCSAIALDITKFFDTLDYQILKDQLTGLLQVSRLPQDYYNLFKSVTRFAQVNRDDLYKLFGISTHNPKAGRYRVCKPKEFRDVVRGGGHIVVNEAEKGIPQGSPISSLLSNIYMLEFDSSVASTVADVGGKYYRYCDDILCIVPSQFKGYVARTHFINSNCITH